MYLSTFCGLVWDREFESPTSASYLLEVTYGARNYPARYPTVPEITQHGARNYPTRYPTRYHTIRCPKLCV